MRQLLTAKTHAQMGAARVRACAEGLRVYDEQGDSPLRGGRRAFSQLPFATEVKKR